MLHTCVGLLTSSHITGKSQPGGVQEGMRSMLNHSMLGTMSGISTWPRAAASSISRMSTSGTENSELVKGANSPPGRVQRYECWATAGV